MSIIDSFKERDKVIYNGALIEDSSSYIWSDKRIRCRIYDEDYSELIRDEKINSLFIGVITEIVLSTNAKVEDTFEKEQFNFWSTKIMYSNGKYKIQLFVQLDIEEWDKGFSILQYTNKVKSAVKSNPELEFYLDDEESITNGFNIIKKIKYPNSTVREEEMKLLNIFFDIHSTVHNELLNTDKHSVSVELDIAEPFKTAYTQYLAYFIQFLKDIGIESQTSIAEQTNKILMEVTPVDKETALDSIRQCLDVYLRLSESKEIEVYDDYSNVAYMQLKANIGHLKSQLMLTQTALGQQQATIEQQNITIDMLKYINNEKALIEKEDNEMKLLDGVISVGEIDCKVFKLDLGKLLKVLSRKR